MSGEVLNSASKQISRQLRPFFCMRILIETRITDSGPANAIGVLDEPASHSIQVLYSDDQLEQKH